MKNILLIFIILILIDLIWLNLIKDKYAEQIFKIQNEDMSVNYYSAFIVYVILAIGLYYLTKNEPDTISKVKTGALIGLVTYGVYDFTNGAIFKNWDFKLGIMDTIWGSILCGSTMYVYSKFSL
jgi:uncharacterized membrane protein